MSRSPQVSVLMTVYNRDKFLDDAITSVLQSSFPDFELIIVDDCSTDRSREIARKYQEVDKRIRYYENEKNLGDYNNRNRAAEYAEGKYIKYLDADDLMYPWCLEIWVREMEKHPDAGFSLEAVLNDTDKPLPELLSPYEAYRRNYFKFHFLHKAPTSSMIRADVFRKHKGFSGKRLVGDLEFWLKLAAYENILIVPNGLTWYRHHPQQESTLARESSLFSFDYMVIELEALNNPDCPLNREEKIRVINYMHRLQGRSILRSFLIERKFGDAFEKMRRSGLTLSEALRYCFNKKI